MGTQNDGRDGEGHGRHGLQKLGEENVPVQGTFCFPTLLCSEPPALTGVCLLSDASKLQPGVLRPVKQLRLCQGDTQSRV